MAVVTFKEIHNGRKGDDKLGDVLTASLVRVFRVVTDSATDDHETIALHASCPNYGDVHPNNSLAYVKKRSIVNQMFSKKVWLVTVTYSTEWKVQEYQEDPTAEAAKITWRSEQFVAPASRDKDGNAVVNSAGDLFDPPEERDDSRWVATIRKNMQGVPSWIFQYQDAINSRAFQLDGLGIPAYYAKMQAIEIGEQQVQNDISYRVLTMHMTLKLNTHIFYILDAGFNRIDPNDSSKRVKITVLDDQGNRTEPTAPWPLNGSGAPIQNPTTSNNQHVTYHVYPELDFNYLPLQ